MQRDTCAGPALPRRIIGFHQDEESHWVADLECGHTQHVRHDPPWQVRPWVTTEAGRASFLVNALECVSVAPSGRVVPLASSADGTVPPPRLRAVLNDSKRFKMLQLEITTMSSMHRTVEGEVLVHHLTQDEWMIDPILLARTGRTARTLVKEGPLRLTLMAIAAGGNLPVHSTDGPVTIHVLRGEVSFEALGQEYPLKTGDVLVLAPGVEHSARSAEGVLFLLTVVHAPSAGSRTASE